MFFFFFLQPVALHTNPKTVLLAFANLMLCESSSSYPINRSVWEAVWSNMSVKIHRNVNIFVSFYSQSLEKSQVKQEFHDYLHVVVPK